MNVNDRSYDKVPIKTCEIQRIPTHKYFLKKLDHSLDIDSDSDGQKGLQKNYYVSPLTKTKGKYRPKYLINNVEGSK